MGARLRNVWVVGTGVILSGAVIALAVFPGLCWEEEGKAMFWLRYE